MEKLAKSLSRIAVSHLKSHVTLIQQNSHVLTLIPKLLRCRSPLRSAVLGFSRTSIFTITPHFHTPEKGLITKDDEKAHIEYIKSEAIRLTTNNAFTDEGFDEFVCLFYLLFLFR